MKREEYRKMHAVEDRMWWYRGLHANLLTVLRRYGRVAPGAALLDAGCGTGGLLSRLCEAWPQRLVLGLDADSDAIGFAAEKTGARLCVGSVDHLPIASDSLAAIVSADVLYHRAVDEAAALAEFHRCLAPGGVLVLNLPAYEWMMSAHDRAVETARRYTARRIRDRLGTAGFGRVTTTYWNTLLFPLMVLRRKLLATRGDGSDVMLYPAPIEFLFRLVMHIENGFVARGIRLPFGGSVLAVAVK